jgi:hypothetical protein
MGARFFAFVLSAILVTAVHADPQKLDCNSAPGGYLCRQITSIQSLMDTSCTGDPCDSLFRDQGQSFGELVTYYNQNVFAQPVVDATLGAAAAHLASTICSYQWTGDSDTFSNAIFRGNQLLDVLKELQVGAGRSASYCQLSIQ